MKPLALFFLVCCALASAQTSRPPVVFVRGYDFTPLLTGGSCSPSTQASDIFGNLPAQVQADGVSYYYFDQCSAAGMQTVSIENLGQLFAKFLTTINAPQVDIVAHSMGGLIVRAYLAGMQPSGAFAPPADPRIRKFVMIAVPNFGLEIPSTYNDAQLMELRAGSSFLYSLARWNQETDDLRGLDTLAVVGNSGTQGPNDGVVPLNSASLNSFGRAAVRTRALPYCHTAILALLQLCTGMGIATAQDTADITESFLSGTTDWTTKGTTLPTTGSATGGVMVTARDQNDVALNITGVAYTVSGSTLTAGSGAFYSLGLPPSTYTFKGLMGTASVVSEDIAIAGGSFTAGLIKAPPQMTAVIPAAGLIDARVVAPGSLVSFYGFGLAASTAQASGAPFPAALNGTSIMAGGTAIPVYFVSSNQVNAYIPPGLSGLVNVQIKTAQGQHTTSLFVAPTSPALFVVGQGAAATHLDGSLITAANPAMVGETITMYATGLGATTNKGGIDYANTVPSVTVGGVNATVLFGGRTPGFTGLDQINVTIPTGAKGSVQVVAMSGGRISNSVTLAVQ